MMLSAAVESEGCLGVCKCIIARNTHAKVTYRIFLRD